LYDETFLTTQPKPTKEHPMKKALLLVPTRIRLVIEGDHALVVNPGTKQVNNLRLDLGTHDVCGGLMNWFANVSSQMHAIYCERCKFRLEIPSRIGTYTELKEWTDKAALGNAIPMVYRSESPSPRGGGMNR